MSASKTIYVRNMYDSYLVIGTKIFHPFGEPSDTLSMTSDEMINPDIQRLLSIGRLETIDNPTEIFSGSIPDPMDGVVPVYQKSKEVLKLVLCLGKTSKNRLCSREVTYKADKEPPLCRDHANQIDDIEYDALANEWHRKDGRR